MELKTLTAAQFNNFYEKLRDSKLSLDEVLSGGEKTGLDFDPTFAQESLKQFRQQVENWEIKFPGTRITNSTRNSTQTSIRLHQALPPEASYWDAGIWSWLALGHFYDYVQWANQGGLKSENLNIPSANRLGRQVQNYIRKSWLWADITVDETRTEEGKYWMTELGNIDLRDSGIVRHVYAGSRNLARAFVQWQSDPRKREAYHPGARQYLKRVVSLQEHQIQLAYSYIVPTWDSEKDKARSETDDSIRQMFKDLRLLQPTIGYEYLEEDEFEEIFVSIQERRGLTVS